jgi:hypothetical protein
MKRFTGRLNDGDRVVLERLSGWLDADGNGRLEGVLDSHLPIDHPYCLAWGDGRLIPIRVTRVLASNPTGNVVLGFRVDRERVGTGSRLRC